MKAINKHEKLPNELQYLLNKNERKLSKLENHIILTEKEVQLLELFLKKKIKVNFHDQRIYQNKLKNLAKNSPS